MNWKLWLTEILVGALAGVVLSILLLMSLEHWGISQVIKAMFGGQ